MNILLFGKTGQVGWELQRALAPLGNLIALDVHSTDYCGDFSNPEGVAETVRSIRPDIIVNAAAHTVVDKAESEPEFAQLLNATSVEAIAKAANEVGARVIHYSTDYVFPGTGEIPWQETDATAPLNVYGETKLAGEKHYKSIVRSTLFSVPAGYMQVKETILPRQCYVWQKSAKN